MDRLIQETEGFSFADIEELRTRLVLNKILRDMPWDLDSAFENFTEFREELRERRILGAGFASEMDSHNTHNAPVGFAAERTSNG